MTSKPIPIARFFGALFAVVALMGAVATTLGAQAANAASNPPAAGLQFGFNEWPSTSNFPLQKQLNAPVARMNIGWNTVQAAGSGSWDWELADSHYQGILSAGLKPLIVVVAAPCWAHPSNPCEGLDTAWHPPDRAYYNAWAEFNSRVASRYPGAAAIEVWNEQNIAPLFPPYPDAARYTELLKTAYTAVKSVANMPVISGGLFVSPASGPYGIADSTFLKAMYDAGAKGFMDGIGIHPYLYSNGADGSVTYDPAAIQAPLDRVRAVRNAAGASSTPLWITESGESTATESGFPAAATESQQASDLVSMVRAVKSMPDVRMLIIHRLIDRPLYLGGWYAKLESGFGVFRTDGTAKPAACALSAELGGTLSGACPAVVTPQKPAVVTPQTPAVVTPQTETQATAAVTAPVNCKKVKRGAQRKKCVNKLKRA